jgi:signal transduction histidine kinase
MDVMLKKLISISEIKRESENLSEVKIADAIREVKRKYDHLITQHSIQYNMDCPEDIMFKSSAALLDCIVSNLLENAVFFTSLKHTGHARVEIMVRCTGGDLKVSVYDNGVGIDESIRPQLFNMFFTGHEMSKGNGLGLYMVNKCVLALHGRITLESEANRYTKFEVILPSLS